jgi:site-specific DNA-methyltransferase (adenine-specific)
MINTHNIDCLEFMRNVPDKYYDLAIVDIPYGLGDKLTQGGTWASKYKKGDAGWDILPNEIYFNELFRISQNQIIWGGNYANLPPTRGFIIWDKVALMDTMADCEFAWTSFDKNAKIFRHVRNTSEKRIHITQKPVALYKWLLTKYAKQGDKIFDSHGGSMSIAIACHDLNFDLDVCELDTEYYEQALKRLHAHQLQTKLF